MQDILFSIRQRQAELHNSKKNNIPYKEIHPKLSLQQPAHHSFIFNCMSLNGLTVYPLPSTHPIYLYICLRISCFTAYVRSGIQTKHPHNVHHISIIPIHPTENVLPTTYIVFAQQRMLIYP